MSKKNLAAGLLTFYSSDYIINKSGTIWGGDLYLPDSSRYRKTVGRTKKQAQAVERKIKTQIADGTWGIKKKPDITFADFLASKD